MGVKPKSFIYSRTIVGAVIMAISLISQFYNVPVSQAELDQASGDLTQAAEGVAAIVGFGLVIYGRIKAIRPVAILGK